MKILNCFIILVLCLMSWLKTNAQWGNEPEIPMNQLEWQMFGNRGFLTFIYNRTIFEHSQFAVVITPAFGRIPGSHDKDTIPSYGHFGLGTAVVYRFGLNGIFAGLSYAGLLKLEQDKVNSEDKKYTQGMLVDLGYMRFFPSGAFFKLSFTPVLLGKGYKRLTNVPFGLSIGYSF